MNKKYRNKILKHKWNETPYWSKENVGQSGMKSILANLFTKSIAIIVFFALWWIIGINEWINPIILPSLEDVFRTFIELASKGILPEDILISLWRTAMGFLAGIVIAVPLGILMGWSAQVEKYIDPLLQVFRNTSVLAMFPIFILVFGLGEISKIAIICWGSLWPCLLNTIDGVKSVDPVLIRFAKSMGISSFGLLRHIIVPAALPAILTGVRVSAGIAVIVLVAAEMLGANKGLGFLIFNSQQRFQIPHMYVGIVTIATLGVLINLGLIRMERKLVRWHKELTGNKQ